MSELAPLISDLALILICAGVMTLVFKRLKQPLVLGYIVAGFLASPHFSLTPSVIDTASIHTWSEIGVIFLLFALVGLAWASINVNSLPMVVEMCKGSDIGKFTGLYYTFSMSAQIITPIIAGYLLENISYKVLFLYSSIAVFIAFATMLFVRHGDNKVEAKRGLEAFDVED